MNKSNSKKSRGLLELHEAKGIEGLGHIKWDIALCLLAVYLICYFSLWKGISTSGKVRNRRKTLPFNYGALFVMLSVNLTVN